MITITKPFEDYGFKVKFKSSMSEVGKFSISFEDFQTRTADVNYVVENENRISYTVKKDDGDRLYINAESNSFLDVSGLVEFMFEDHYQRFLMEEALSGIMHDDSKIRNFGKEGVYGLRMGTLDNKYYGFSLFTDIYNIGFMVNGIHLNSHFYPKIPVKSWIYIERARQIPDEIFTKEYKDIYMRYIQEIVENKNSKDILKKDMKSFIMFLADKL